MKERNYFLDGLRGIAAISVAAFHLTSFFGINLVPGGYLAVDFFFMLSGFVIALAYDKRITAGLSAPKFITMRIVRLYPLFLLGVVLGAVKSASQVILHQAQAMTISQFALATILNGLMLPVPFKYPLMFPLNGPLWSLFYEFLINIAYALVLVRLRSPWLIGLSLCGAAVLVMNTIGNPVVGLDGGYDLPTFGIGIARVTYGFCLGMLIARHVRGTRRRSAVGAAGLLAALLLFMFLPADGIAIGIRDLVFVFLIVPAIVWIGAKIDVPAQIVPFFSLLGDISYPLYAVHYPIVLGLCYVGVRLHLPAQFIVISTLAAVIAAAILAGRLYDLPVRKKISEKLRLQESARPLTLASEASG